MTKYNINELLDLRKHLEEKLATEINILSASDFITKSEIHTDHTNGGKQTPMVIPEKKTFAEMFAKYDGILKEIVDVKTAITKYNAEALKDKLFQREAMRKRLTLLKTWRTLLPREEKLGRNVLREDKDGRVQESLEVRHTPMFKHDDIDKAFDEFAAQERKLNTEIQKINLEQQIELGS